MNTMAKIKKIVTSCKRFDKKQIIRNLTKNRSLNKRTTGLNGNRRQTTPLGCLPPVFFFSSHPAGHWRQESSVFVKPKEQNLSCSGYAMA